jgi:hypothetical protein
LGSGHVEIVDDGIGGAVEVDHPIGMTPYVVAASMMRVSWATF